jgi:hypothetical protein
MKVEFGLKTPDFSSTHQPRIVQLILNADMRFRHNGLSDLAKKAGVEVENLSEGHFVVFINAKRNYLALYGARNLLACLKLNRGHIDMEIIQTIPKIFMSKGRIDYDHALQILLEKKLIRS